MFINKILLVTIESDTSSHYKQNPIGHNREWCIITSSQDEPQLTSCLKDTIVDLSLSYTSLDSLKATIILLKRERKYHLLLVRILQELASHSAVQVRCCVATLLGVSTRISLFHLSIYISICLSIYLSIYLSVYLSIY